MPEDLPEEVTEISDFSFLIFGEKKIGKTTLVSKFPKVFFFPTEPGTKAIRVFQPLDKKGHRKVIDSWQEFEGYVNGYLEYVGDRYGANCVDVADGAYELCFDYMCKNVLFVDHPQDANDYGKSWKEITKEFKRVMGKLIASPGGHVSLSHVKVRETEHWFTGDQWEQIKSSLSGAGHEYITATVDLWAYYGYFRNERRLWITGNEKLDAGNRIQEMGRFRDKESGELINYIPMGKSAEEGYDNLLKAFENDLTVEPDRPKAKKLKRKKKVKKSS